MISFWYIYLKSRETLIVTNIRYICLVLLLNLYLADEPLVAYKHLQARNFIKERL